MYGSTDRRSECCSMYGSTDRRSECCSMYGSTDRRSECCSMDRRLGCRSTDLLLDGYDLDGQRSADGTLVGHGVSDFRS